MTISGWSAGRTPLAMNVVTTGIWARSARRRSSFAPEPADHPVAREDQRALGLVDDVRRPGEDGRSGDGRRGW